MKHSAIQQYHYNKWANNRVFEHLKKLPDEVYDREIKSVFSSVEEVIVHIYQTDGMWLSVISGDPFPETMKVIRRLKEASTAKNLADMEELYEAVSARYIELLNSLDDPDKTITILHPKYGELTTPITDLIKHVVNHGTYHRGNITAMLRQQGHAGVPTDYIFYLYDEETSD